MKLLIDMTTAANVARRGQGPDDTDASVHPLPLIYPLPVFPLSSPLRPLPQEFTAKERAIAAAIAAEGGGDTTTQMQVRCVRTQDTCMTLANARIICSLMHSLTFVHFYVSSPSLYLQLYLNLQFIIIIVIIFLFLLFFLLFLLLLYLLFFPMLFLFAGAASTRDA